MKTNIAALSIVVIFLVAGCGVPNTISGTSQGVNNNKVDASPSVGDAPQQDSVTIKPTDTSATTKHFAITGLNITGTSIMGIIKNTSSQQADISTISVDFMKGEKVAGHAYTLASNLAAGSQTEFNFNSDVTGWDSATLTIDYY